jgi:hypothetical protein
MALFDALPRDLRLFIAFGPGFTGAYGLENVAAALRDRRITVEWVKDMLRQGFRGGPGAEQHKWKAAGHLMPYPHVGANATLMWTQPFDQPKNARERLAARRRVARLRMPAPNPIREVKHVASGVICL